jgi:S-phase kinase-associated protein 1
MHDVIEYCSRAQDASMPAIAGPLPSAQMDDFVPATFAAFITSLPDNRLFAVINAAHFLEIPGLMTLGCARVATRVMGKTTEQIRAEFCIRNDFTPEEEARVQQENRWCEDA